MKRNMIEVTSASRSKNLRRINSSRNSTVKFRILFCFLGLISTLDGIENRSKSLEHNLLALQIVEYVLINVSLNFSAIQLCYLLK